MSLPILDTTILSNFAHAQRPELIQTALGESATTTAAVITELRQGEALGFVPRVNWRWLPILDLSADEERLAETYLAVLELGEATCLAAAVTRQAHFFSDDLTARRLAQATGLPVSGTIGLLLALIRREVVTLAEGDGLLATMMRQGYQAPAVTLRVYLEEG
jgi:predicted nucleic acid-binding protein